MLGPQAHAEGHGHGFGRALAVTALMVRGQITSIKSDLPQLRSAISDGQIDQAQATADDLAAHAKRAHDLTTGPAWWTAQYLPWAGDPGHPVATAERLHEVLPNSELVLAEHYADVERWPGVVREFLS